MLKIGKLDSDLLQRLVFKNIKYKRPEVLTRAGIGEDCAVIDYGESHCVMSTDPITASIKDIGRLSVHISCNDIASNGVQPIGIMLAVLLPEGTTKEEIEEMMKQAGKVSEQIGVEIIGGHTEITSAVNKPVIVSTAIGIDYRKATNLSNEIKPEDYILMTKSAGLEGAGIIACEEEEQLKDVLTEEEIREAKALLSKVSVVKEGVIAGKLGALAMHDVTEGGVLGAVWETCKVCNLGAELWIDEVPVEEVTKKICNKFEVDFLRLISSGSMIIIASKENKDEIITKIKNEGIEINCIGKIKKLSEGTIMKTGDVVRAIEPPKSDEIYKVII